MGKIRVSGKMRSSNEKYEETFTRAYDADGVLHESRVLANEEDYASQMYERTSRDNGRTFGEWVTCYNDEGDGRRGQIPGNPWGDEYLGGVSPYLYDPKTGCTVGVGSDFFYLKGHNVGYFEMWGKGEDNVRTHAYLAYRRPDGSEVKKMIELEEGGAAWDPENPRNPAFIEKNRAMAADLGILPDGDLMFLLYPTMTLCCRLAGADLASFFPSCPNLMHGMIFVRLRWNAEKNEYDMILSDPIMLSDVQSARGIMEPRVLFLENDRWMIVFRGAATDSPVWHTRTDPGTPPFKWYTFSDDGGRHFVPPMPWHFDTREVVYSPASISGTFRSSKTGKLYWLGNVLTEPWLIDSSGSDPRWPLVICEVDEKYGYLIKNTLTEIDTKREGDTYWLELSNFNLLENRETLDLEIRLTKINQRKAHFEDDDWYSEAWEYTVTFEE